MDSPEDTVAASTLYLLKSSNDLDLRTGLASGESIEMWAESEYRRFLSVDSCLSRITPDW